MIYLIGGSPRSGKTSIAKGLAKKLDYELISLDDVREHEIEEIGTEKAEERFILEKVYENNDDFFQKYSPQEVLELEIKDAVALWPKTEKIIDEKLKHNLSVIIEGVQLLPQFLEKYKNNPAVKILLFYKKDKQLIWDGFSKNNDPEDWLLNNTKNQKTLELAAETFSLYGDFFEQEAGKHGFKAINTEQDFENTIKQAINEIN